MAKNIDIQISIDGKKLDYFSSLIINQEFSKHHEFVLNVSQDALESKTSHSLTNSKELIGKPISITFGLDGNDKAPNTFKGIVSEVSMSQSFGLSGDIIIRGYGLTLLLESGKQLASYYDKSLSSIVKELTGSIGELKTTVKPQFTGSIAYMSQYKETDYEFIQRLAAEYGEWFYYDGQTLYFGNPSLSETVDLMYGSDISSLQLSMKILPSKFTHYAYKSDQDELLTANAPSSVGYLDGFGKTSLEASDKVFSKQSYLPLHQRVASKQELDQVTKSRKSQIASSFVVLQASGDNPYVKLGGQVNIEVEKREAEGFAKETHGKYLVTSIKHRITGTGEYSHTIEALPSGVEVIPASQVALPVAENQVATVKDNNDPKGLGRVRAQMFWQEEKGQMTDWIRVLTPDGGGGDKVSKNRGFVFIPEVGDQVILGFQGNDPNRPFVMGSTFHGKTGGGGGGGNKSKSLTTGSGSTVTLDDAKGSITISDPSGNKVVLNGDGTMTITAPNKLDITSKEINITADNKITIDGKSTVAITSKEVSVDGSSKATLNSKTKVEVGSPSTNIEGKTQLKLQSTGIVDLEGAAMANVKGGLLNLNCG